MDKLHTTLYPFLWQELGLTGFTKEIFAILFGFWAYGDRDGVHVTYKTLTKISGATRPTISTAIQILEDKGFICAYRQPGKPTKYQITIAADIVKDFDHCFRSAPENSKTDKPDRFNGYTTSGKIIEQHNKKEDKNEIVNYVNSEFNVL